MNKRLLHVYENLTGFTYVQHTVYTYTWIQFVRTQVLTGLLHKYRL